MTHWARWTMAIAASLVAAPLAVQASGAAGGPAIPQLGAAALPTQAHDTTVTVQGFIQEDPGSDALTLVVPLPLEALGVRTFVLAIQGKADHWRRYLNRYVEATGRVSALSGPARLGIDIDRLKEAEPPGTARRTFDRGLSQRALIKAVVIPNRFSWTDAQGRATGVNPLVLYTLNEREATRQESPIFAVLPTDNLLCVAVRPLDGLVVWDSMTRVRPGAIRGVTLDQSGTFRDAMQLPQAAARKPGRYSAEVGICQMADYQVTVEFEVQ